jgi:hypothetical protein
MPDNKILSVSASEVRWMACVAVTGVTHPKEYDFEIGRRMLRTVWLADLWPAWPDYNHDPGGAVRARYQAMDESPS